MKIIYLSILIDSHCVYFFLSNFFSSKLYNHRLLSGTDHLYLILGGGHQIVDDDSSSSEEISPEIEKGS